MEEIKEKFTIKITDDGVDLLSGTACHLHFTASEALMLLDILKQEENRLEKKAGEASPMPMKLKF